MLARLATVSKAIGAAVVTIIGQWGIIWTDHAISIDEFNWAKQVILPVIVAIGTFFAPKNRERKAIG